MSCCKPPGAKDWTGTTSARRDCAIAGCLKGRREGRDVLEQSVQRVCLERNEVVAKKGISRGLARRRNLSVRSASRPLSGASAVLRTSLLQLPNQQPALTHQHASWPSHGPRQIALRSEHLSQASPLPLPIRARFECAPDARVWKQEEILVPQNRFAQRASAICIWSNWNNALQ